MKQSEKQNKEEIVKKAMDRGKAETGKEGIGGKWNEGNRKRGKEIGG